MSTQTRSTASPGTQESYSYLITWVDEVARHAHVVRSMSDLATAESCLGPFRERLPRIATSELLLFLGAAAARGSEHDADRLLARMVFGSDRVPVICVDRVPVIFESSEPPREPCHLSFSVYLDVCHRARAAVLAEIDVRIPCRA